MTQGNRLWHFVFPFLSTGAFYVVEIMLQIQLRMVLLSLNIICVFLCYSVVSRNSTFNSCRWFQPVAAQGLFNHTKMFRHCCFQLFADVNSTVVSSWVYSLRGGPGSRIMGLWAWRCEGLLTRPAGGFPHTHHHECHGKHVFHPWEWPFTIFFLITWFMKNDLIISICTSLTSQETNYFPVNHMSFLFHAFIGRNALCQSGRNGSQPSACWRIGGNVQWEMGIYHFD